MRILMVIISVVLMGWTYPYPSQNSQAEYDQLIAETRHLLELYEPIMPYEWERQFAISDLELTPVQLSYFFEYIDSPVTDSVIGENLIFFLQENIMTNIDSIVHHPFFNPKTIAKDLYEDGYGIVQSPDYKLINFSLDEKTGGTYRSHISATYYSGWKKQQGQDNYFEGDGYSRISQLQSGDTTKYIMEYYVRGCSYCFLTGVQVIHFDGEKIIEDFRVEVNSRDWSTGAYYNEADSIISLEYDTDDLTEHCWCDSVATNYEAYECWCYWKYDGKEFVEFIPQGRPGLRRKDR